PSLLMLTWVGPVRRHPVGIVANKECDRGYAGVNYAPLAGGRILQRRGMRRQPSPTHCPSQAKLVEDLRIVIRYAPAQCLAFPCVRRNFKTLELPENFEGATFPQDLRSWGKVLPT